MIRRGGTAQIPTNRLLERAQCLSRWEESTELLSTENACSIVRMK